MPKKPAVAASTRGHRTAWRRSILAALSLAALAVGAAACGSASSGSSAPAPTGAPEVLAGTLATLAATGDATGGSVVRSGAVDGAPRTVVTNLSTGAETTLPGHAPLFAVAIWQAGGSIGVVGARCPAWTSGAAPRWDDHSPRNVPEICGSTAYEVWRVDRRTGEAHRLDAAGLTAGNGYVAMAVRDGNVLLAGQGDGGGQVALDLSTAEVTRLPSAPDTGGSAEAGFQPCLGEGGRPFGVLAWSGEAPPAVTAGGWETSAVTSRDGTSLVALTPAQDDTWSPLSVSGTASSFHGVSGCGQAGLWRLGRTGGSQVDVKGEKAEITPIPSPPSGSPAPAETNVYPLEGAGGPLAVVRSVPTSENPDAPRSADGYLWSNGTWKATPTVKLGSSSYPFVNGDRVAALNPQSGKYPLKVVLA